MRADRVPRIASLVAALVGVNFALTFAQVWPTFAIRPAAAVSIELLVLLAGMLLVGALGHRPSRRTLTALGSVLTAMTVARYAAVTTAGLYGRPVHLYFDLPHIPNVFAMLAKVADPWLLAAAGAGCAVIIAGLLVGLRAALARIADAASRPGERAAAAAAGVAAAVLAAAGTGSSVGGVRFAEPVTGTVLAQAERFVDALQASRRDALLPPPASFGDGPLAALGRRDVLVVFVESYGAVAFDRADVRDGVAESRARLERAVSATGRRSVSAFVESPTFAGASWLAHASLMTGGRIDNGGAYARLLTDTRDTLPKRFARAGYRTVAVMPGLREDWPEGRFFGFDALYDAAALDYHGPAFGWWRIPDQYALAALDAAERRSEGRAPLFAFFATLSTHVPFRPTPPYQPDWSRLASDEPFSRASLERSLARRPDWLNLAPAYVESLRYAYETIAGYLEWRADDDFVLVVLGDHQPAASVSGPGARWDVPVHVIASRAGPLEALAEAGFEPGLVPHDAPLGEMHELAPLLLDALDGGAARRVTSGTANGTAPTRKSGMADGAAQRPTSGALPPHR